MARIPYRGGSFRPARRMRLAALLDRLRATGLKPPHEAAVLRAWLAGGPLDAGRRDPEGFLPLAFRRAMPAISAELDAVARVREEVPAADGAVRLLVALGDGEAVESVLLPRGGACVSTQAGCAVGCTFCATGRDGLRRQLSSGEILAQVVLARRRRPVRKVVFMGMGEPAHNLDAVLEAIALLGTAGGIGHKNLVLSTVGDRRVFDRAGAGPVRPALALSLHSTFPDRRRALLPRAPALDPAELVDLGERYARDTGYPIQYQWTLLAGVNDGDDEVERIGALLAGRYAVMNFIALNPGPGLPYSRPAPGRAAAMIDMLRRRGVLAKLRDSAGQEVEGGCGQLRARSVRVPVVAAH